MTIIDVSILFGLYMSGLSFISIAYSYFVQEKAGWLLKGMLLMHDSYLFSFELERELVVVVYFVICAKELSFIFNISKEQLQ